MSTTPTEVVVMCYIPDLGQRAFALLAGPFVMHYNPPGNSLSTSGKLTNPSIQGREPRREPGGSPDLPPGAAGAPGWLIWLPRA